MKQKYTKKTFTSPVRLLSSGHYTGPAPHWIIARLPGWEGSLEDIYIDRRDKTLFIVVIGWNKGIIFIGEDMVLTALRRSPRSKVQRSSAVLEFPPLSGTPSLLVRTSNWSFSTRTCKEHWWKMRCALCIELCCTLSLILHRDRQHECNDSSYNDVT